MLVKLLCVGAFFLPSISWANLVWKSHLQEFHPTLSDTAIVAQYPFQNKGTAPVTITAIRTSCGCTGAVSDKSTYGPGEQGTITVNYTFGSQTGLQEKVITVVTDEPKAKPYFLFLKATLPEWLKINPKFVSWAIGDPLQAKTIDLSVVSPTPFKVLSVTCDSMDINAILQVVKDRSHYTISVLPVTTKAAAKGLITITTDLKIRGEPKTFFSFAEVRAAPADAKKMPK